MSCIGTSYSSSANRGKGSVRIKLAGLNECDAVQLVPGACGNAKVYAPERLRVHLRRIADRILDRLK